MELDFPVAGCQPMASAPDEGHTATGGHPASLIPDSFLIAHVWRFEGGSDLPAVAHGVFTVVGANCRFELLAGFVASSFSVIVERCRTNEFVRRC